jgi:biopolymer transport protein ExbD
MTELNITPFVDVMLVLLIVFMVTLPIIHHSIPLELPKASSTPMNAHEQDITLKVVSADKIYWNNTLLSSLKELKEYIMTINIDQNHTKIYLAIDQKLPYGLAIELIAALQQMGIYQIGFISEVEQ